MSTPCFCKLARRSAAALTSRYERHLAPHGLTLPQFSLLRTAARHQPIAVAALADRLALDRTTMTRNLGVLLAAGLVAVAANPDDRRERRVCLTAAGGARLGEALAAWAAAQAEVQKILAPRQLAALADITAALENHP